MDVRAADCRFFRRRAMTTPVYPNFAHMLAAPQMPDIVAVDIRSAARTMGHAALPRMLSGLALAASIVGIRFLANRDLRVGLRRCVSRRARHLRTAAQSIEAIVQHRAEDPEVDAILCANPVHDAFSGPSELALGGSTAATDNRGEKIKSRPLASLSHFAAETAGSGRPAARAHACTAERSGADDRSMPCLRRHSPAHSPTGAAFSDPLPHGLAMAIWHDCVALDPFTAARAMPFP
jgi:hypothetical protein